MRYALALTLLALVAGCSTEELVQQSRIECDKIGYTPGTIEHTQCTERGTRERLGDAEDVADAVAWAILIEAF